MIGERPDLLGRPTGLDFGYDSPSAPTCPGGTELRRALPVIMHTLRRHGGGPSAGR
jgi:hypothetical protein